MNTSDIAHPKLKKLVEEWRYVPYDKLEEGEWDKWVEESPHLLWDKLVEDAPHLFFDKTGTPAIKHITEKLELKLEKMLKGLKVSISVIKGVKSRFILLIGNDEDLLDAAGCYIYCLNCIKGGTSPFYRSFRGKSDVYLKEILTAKNTYKNPVYFQDDLPGAKAPACTGYPSEMEGDLLDHIEQGRSVFFSNLKFPSSSLLEDIGERIKRIVIHWKMYKVDKRGLFVVSAESEKDLPEYFVKQFEKIDLRHGEKDRLQTGCLIFNDKEIKLQDQQIKLWNAVQVPTRVENILNSVFGYDYKIDAKFNSYDRNNFDKAKSTFNKLCKKNFKIRDDIIKNCGLKTYGINEKYTGKINLT